MYRETYRNLERLLWILFKKWSNVMQEIREFILLLVADETDDRLSEELKRVLPTLEQYKTRKKDELGIGKAIYRMDTSNEAYQNIVEFVNKYKGKIVIDTIDIHVSHSKEELDEAIAFIPSLKKFTFHTYDEDNYPYEVCSECSCTGKRKETWKLPYTLKLRKWNLEKRIFRSGWGVSDYIFVSIPMYEYLLKNDISPEYFLPVESDKGTGIIAYLLKKINVLNQGIYEDPEYDSVIVCSKCGANVMQWDLANEYYKNKYLHVDKLEKLEDVNTTYEYYLGGIRATIISKRLYELIKVVEPKENFYPIFSKK